MRKGLGRLLVLALGLGLLLTACTEEPKTGFDAGVYVDGVLKAAYLGQFQADYLEMVGITEAEANTEYHNGIHLEMSHFYNAYGIESNDTELQEEIEELFHDIYSHASLALTGVESKEDGSFLVWVEVAPLDIVRRVHEDLPELQAEFYARYPEDNTMTTAEYEAYDIEWAQMVVGLYQEKLETIGYLPAQTVELRVERDSRGYYGINSDDFRDLDALVIDYTLPEPQPEESPSPGESGQPGETGEPQESPKPEEGDAVQTGGQPPEASGTPGESEEPQASQEPQESQPPESVAPQASQQPSESPAPQESVNPNDPTPPTTVTPIPGLETE